MAYTFKHGDRPLDDYTVQRAIGRGGFGEVYYAMSDGGREVALKYLKENPAIELRGVSHCINLKSPHLVAIFDVKKNADGEYFVIMEYCSGPSLRDLMIAEPKGFSAEKAAFFTREIAKGLSYLHDRGIVHRDLKPGNIFFDDGYVKIGDYGLSKFISVSRHSAQTSSVGTVHYMAPEIGSGNYSRGVDIYALGVMLYEMLLGKVPFEGSTMAEVLMKHLTVQPELDELPGAFGHVIRKALQKDPNDRYQTAEEMLDDLLSGEEIQRSLAGFSTKSLEGAVRIGGRDRADSPIPSPNPAPRGFVFQADIGRGQTPGAIGEGSELTMRLAKKMDRISRKIDRKMAKLAGTVNVEGKSADRSPSENGKPAGIPWAQPAPSRGERRKRFVLVGLLLVALSVGYGLIVGGTAKGRNADELGASAGMLVAALYFSVILGRGLVRWFGVDHGPGWAERLVRAISATPLLAVGCAPLFDMGTGFSMWLGLIALAAFGKFERDSEGGTDGEIEMGALFTSAIFAMILTTVASVVLGSKVQSFMFISAGIAAAATLVLQAGAWWNVRHRYLAAAGAKHEDDGRPRGGPGLAPRSADLMPAPPPIPPHVQMAINAADAAQAQWWKSWESGSSVPPTNPQSALHPLARSMFVRMFWSLIAFALMGGTIVTFVYPLVESNAAYHDVTLAVIMCTGCAAFMIFAIRKATPTKRPGFWRDTIRPFLISVSMFGIGATTTAIAREWNHGSACELESEAHSIVVVEADRIRSEVRAAMGKVMAEIPEPIRPLVPPVHAAGWEDDGQDRCLCDGDRVALIAGLTMSSLMFLGLTLLTGGKPRRPHVPKPFLRGSESVDSPSAEVAAQGRS